MGVALLTGFIIHITIFILTWWPAYTSLARDDDIAVCGHRGRHRSALKVAASSVKLS